MIVHIANGLEQAVELKALYSAGENDGSIIEKEKLVLHPLAKFAEGGQAFFSVITMAVLFASVLNFIAARGLDRLGGEVPFIDHHDAGAVVPSDEVGDFFVLLHNAGFGINHQHGNIATLDGGGCAGDTEVFERVFDPAFFAHACSINEETLLLPSVGLDGERYIHCIAGGAGDVTYNHAIALGERVDDGGFSYIRPAHKCKLERLGCGGALLSARRFQGKMREALEHHGIRTAIV